MAGDLRVVAFDFDEVEKVFARRREAFAEELGDGLWTELFDFSLPPEHPGEDPYRGVAEVNEERYDEAAVERMRAAVAAMIAGRSLPDEMEHGWEDAFFGLCVHFGDVLGTEFFDRVTPETIASVEAVFIENAQFPPGFLADAIHRATVPLALPPPSPGVTLGYMSMGRATELAALLETHRLHSDDREAMGGAIQVRHWLQDAKHVYSLLFHFTEI